ncbi:hypothetical protein [Mangrovibacterium lignilyticum]|uniref:hypothetical protein n=1 Tax=Mangrovibacterium lignilyticum TaxID=2668052 RepID=UPI0013D22DA2|nr:hypothetical protein [Mangrovibacterium lignilyticum]
MKSIFFIPFVLVGFSALSNDPIPVDSFNKNNVSKYLEGVDTTVYKIPDEFREQAYVALSYYPELKGKKLKFKFKNQKTTMSCIPRWDFLFRKKANRTYVIRIDNKLKNNEGVLLADVPFNAQIGVIGHELGHVIDYEGKSIWGLIGTGFGYLFPAYRHQLENQIDEITIHRGLGNQLAAFADYVFHESQANEKYLQYKRKYYYQAEQIHSLMIGAGTVVMP